jgi:hypothetical protein
MVGGIETARNKIAARPHEGSTASYASITCIPQLIAVSQLAAARHGASYIISLRNGLKQLQHIDIILASPVPTTPRSNNNKMTRDAS